MTRVLYHIVTIGSLLILSNCKKIEAPNAEAAKIFGKWKYISNSGGFSGAGGSTRFPEGSTVEFTENGHFKVYEGSSELSSVKFKIEMKESIYSLDLSPALVYTNGDYEVYQVLGQELFISDNHYDGYTYVFEKL
ncbi:MAG: hypothetical protein ACKOBN_06500 [Flavobacteriales bacterium]